MLAWFESIVGPEYAPAVMWTVIAIIALIVLLIVLRLLRGLSSGTFVMGGRNRKARLAVMDATAVDATRRLVLVRRDDVEHLILIGGPTDVVVEQNIRPYTATRQAAEPEAFVPQPAAAPKPVRAVAQENPPRAAERPAPALQRPAQQAPALNVDPAPSVAAPVPEAPYAPPVSPAVERPVAPPVAPPVQREFPSAAVSPRAEPTLDVAPPRRSPTVAAPRRDNDDMALEDEMNRLLSDFTAEPKR